MPDFIFPEEEINKLEKKIVDKLVSPSSPLSDHVSNIVSESLNIPAIIKKVRERIPRPVNGIDGKDAEVSDDLISSMVVRVLGKVQEINKVKDGADGRDGKDGEKGIQGVGGRDGNDGRNGIDGRAGLNGQAGQRGPEGPRGEPGPQGSRGLIGKDGQAGANGREGIDGIDGKDFVITETDYAEIISQLGLEKFILTESFDEILKKLKHDLRTGHVPVRQLGGGGGGLTGDELINQINIALGQETWQEPVSVGNDPGYVYVSGDAGTDGSKRFSVDLGTGFVQLELRTAGVWAQTTFEADTIDLKDSGATKGYVKGRMSYDPTSLGHILDTGVTGVRLNVGQEEYFLVYNNTGSIINNGKACYASGVNIANNILTVALADNASFVTSAQVLGLATHNIGINQMGLVTWRGTVRDFDTTVTNFGLSYLGTSGDLTNVKPLYPKNRIAMGALIKSHITEGQFQVAISSLPRRSASRSYGFTSSDAAAGTHYRAGFYHWSTTSITLNQGSLTVDWGNAGVTRAGHIGVVAQAIGTVDTGQVGLQVTGTLDSEDGPQIASQTAVITDDITSLAANQMEECIEKFSGLVTLSLYIVSGAPTAYSFTFNYGFSKYEDFRNIDGTVTAFNAVWEAGASDSTFDISLKFHNAFGWIYAATGFVPGNGDICNRLTDQSIDSNLILGEEGAYKRNNLLQFINGTAKEGVIIEVVTGATKSIRSMDLHISAFSEELF